MNHINKIARLITEDPNVFNEADEESQSSKDPVVSDLITMILQRGRDRESRLQYIDVLIDRLLDTGKLEHNKDMVDTKRQEMIELMDMEEDDPDSFVKDINPDLMIDDDDIDDLTQHLLDMNPAKDPYDENEGGDEGEDEVTDLVRKYHEGDEDLRIDDPHDRDVASMRRGLPVYPKSKSNIKIPTKDIKKFRLGPSSGREPEPSEDT